MNKTNALAMNLSNFILTIGTLAILLFTKILAPDIVLIGLLAGFLLG